MNLANGIGLVIEKRDDPVLVGLGQIQFFLDLAGHRRVIGRSTRPSVIGVHWVHMPTDPHRDFRMQSALASSFSTRVVQNPIPTPKNTVWDQLLVTRLLLSSRTIHEKMIRGIKQPRHRSV